MEEHDKLKHGVQVHVATVTRNVILGSGGQGQGHQGCLIFCLPREPHISTHTIQHNDKLKIPAVKCRGQEIAMHGHNLEFASRSRIVLAVGAVRPLIYKLFDYLLCL